MKLDRIPTAIDVFSGCGGLTLGLALAGFRVVAGIEIDIAAATAFRVNHPTVELLMQDIRYIKGSELLAIADMKAGDLDLLAGGSPCQGFSRMRTRNGGRTVADERNDLVLEFTRLCDELAPKTILFENVPGLAQDALFTQMKHRLSEKGYSLKPRVLNLAGYGIPQRRKRLFLVGSRLGSPSFPETKGPIVDVRKAIGSLPRPENSSDPLHRSITVHSAIVSERIKQIPKDGGSRMDLGFEAQLECHKKIDGFRDVYGRMHWDEPAPTITRYSINPSKGRYLHPEQDRAISLREASLLQTFPPDYLFPFDEFGRGAIASMIGEAIPPEFARQMGKHLIEHLTTFESPHRDMCSYDESEYALV